MKLSIQEGMGVQDSDQRARQYELIDNNILRPTCLQLHVLLSAAGHFRRPPTA
jgi:hypothetical protein